MQRIFESVKQAFRQSILMLALISLISLSGLFIFVQQPSYAEPISPTGQKLLQQEKMDKESEAANLSKQNVDQRVQAYEQQIKAAEDPDKVFEDNLKAEKESNPGPGIVEKTVEGAKDLVNKVVGND